ncbi:MAG: UDP-glucose dehydrogenase family protein, partial [Limisphaerales bacterium]
MDISKESALLHGSAIETSGLPVYPPTGIKVVVLGGGFVGLVAATGFAQFGHTVTLVEKDADKLKALRAGQVPIYERGLPELINANLHRRRLDFFSGPADAVKGVQAIFLAVGTPSLPSGEADLSAVFEVVETLAPILTPKQIIVLKSTVPVGTASQVRNLLSKNGADQKQVAVVSNPEFLREGTAVMDFFRPQRIVIGGDRPEAMETVAQLYRVGMMDACPILVTNNETAEMIKYASNLFLATKVAFVNELANLCDAAGVNATEVTRGMGLDSRIGPEFLNPGPGFGGSCLPKDLDAILKLAKKQGVRLSIAEAVKEA